MLSFAETIGLKMHLSFAFGASINEEILLRHLLAILNFSRFMMSGQHLKYIAHNVGERRVTVLTHSIMQEFSENKTILE